MMVKIICILFVSVVSTVCFASETYTWEDENGIHFVDDPSKIPAKYVKKARTRPGVGKENISEVNQTLSVKTLPSKPGKSIIVRGNTITVNNKFDDIIHYFRSTDMINQDVSKDRNGSLVLEKHYKVDNKNFTLLVARDITGRGPYYVLDIMYP